MCDEFHLRQQMQWDVLCYVVSSRGVLPTSTVDWHATPTKNGEQTTGKALFDGSLGWQAIPKTRAEPHCPEGCVQRVEECHTVHNRDTRPTLWVSIPLGNWPPKGSILRHFVHLHSQLRP